MTNWLISQNIKYHILIHTSLNLINGCLPGGQERLSILLKTVFPLVLMLQMAEELDTPELNSTTGISSTANDHSELLFFPNPVRFGFSVKGVGTIESIQVFDLNGKSVESKVNIPTAFVDISKLPQGIYFVHVITKNKTYVGKIIKE